MLCTELNAEVMVVVRLTFDVLGVVSADSEGSEKTEVSPPRAGLSGIYPSNPSLARSPGRHLHRWLCCAVLSVSDLEKRI